MTIEYSNAVAQARLTTVQQQIDAAGTHGWLRLFDALGNTLSSVPLAYPSGSASNRTLTFTAPITDQGAALSGTAVSGIVYDGNFNVIASGLVVGVSGSGADVILSPSAQIVGGAAVAITAATITTP